MAGQVVVGVLDGRCEAGQGHRRYVHDVFPSQGLSEMSALDSCHQSVRAFLDTGDCPKEMTGEVFSMIGFLFFFFCRLGAIYENHLKAKIMCVTS